MLRERADDGSNGTALVPVGPLQVGAEEILNATANDHVGRHIALENITEIDCGSIRTRGLAVFRPGLGW